jgi:hypothetical protein
MTQFQVFATSILRTPRRTPTTLSQMRQGLLSRYRLVFLSDKDLAKVLVAEGFQVVEGDGNAETQVLPLAGR